MLEDLFSKSYNEQNYNCAHFVIDAWLEFTGNDISTCMEGFLSPPKMRRARAHSLATWKRLEVPSSPCIALFQACRRHPHVGIFLDGRILHLTENGVSWNRIEDAMLCFNRVRFYNVENNSNCGKLT